MDKDGNLANLKKLLPFVKPYVPRLIGGVIVTVVLTVLGMTPPLIMKYIVDEVVIGGNWSLLEMLLVISISIPILSAGLRVINTFTISYVSHRLIMDLRRALYGRLLQLPMRFYDEMGTGKVMSRLMSDVATVRSMVTMRVLSIITDFITFWVAMFMCLVLNWKMGLILILLLPLYLFNYFGWQGPIRESVRAWRTKMDRVSVGLQERLSGVALVKAYGREKKENRAFTEETHESLSQAMITAVYRAGYNSGVWAVSGLRNTIIFCMGCYFVIIGDMTYGAVMAFLSFAQRMFEPVLNLTQMAMQLQTMMVSVERILEVLEFPIDIADKKDAVTLPHVKGHVKFENVVFEYKAGEPVIKGVDLEVQPGQAVALVGHTGCGKTTLTSLLMRFFDVKSGAIKIDGYDIRDVKVRSLRTQIGQVLQDSVLFNVSIRENLLYGRPDATEADLIEAARVAEIHEFIMRTSAGYDTMLGDEGIKLSVGEKQRLAIARAVLTDPAILILDEATSSLDSLSEALIQKAMANVLKGRTSFAIAHRLSTIVNADIIVVMDQGEIVELGNHETLLEIPDGKYRQLYEQQFAGSVSEGIEAAD
ncbi:MAG: ABC-type multidrug transport system fused ATPase/permease subunit [Candidatus Latescibacterota bacterium]|jgi:ABC-type multidrug transport system fused ATPase/permease subunit